MSIEKLKSNSDGSCDGQTLTELELHHQFDQGIPITLGSPQWSTIHGPYPDVEYLQQHDSRTQSDLYAPIQIPPLRSFIHRQFTRAERTRLSSGSVSTKVMLTNHFTDGDIEHKEIIDDPSRVLEEQDKVYIGFKNRQQAIRVAIFDHDYQTGEERLKEHHELEEEDDD